MYPGNKVFPTYDEYKKYNAEWSNRLYQVSFYCKTAAPYPHLLLHKGTITLPDYIKAKAKGTIIKAEDGVAPHVKAGTPRLVEYYMRAVDCCTIGHCEWGVYQGYCFVDDSQREIIDLDKYPAG